jgi:hypothetical protein
MGQYKGGRQGGGFIRRFFGGTFLIAVGFAIMAAGKTYAAGDAQVAVITVGLIVMACGLLYMFG